MGGLIYKMDVKDIGYEVVDFIYVAKDTDNRPTSKNSNDIFSSIKRRKLLDHISEY
jgi:hypothetical protein